MYMYHLDGGQYSKKSPSAVLGSDPDFPVIILQNNVVAKIPCVVHISENSRYAHISIAERMLERYC